MASRTTPRGIFYGWLVLAAGFFALFVSMGSRNTFGVFILPMTEEFSWDRTTISAVVSVGILVNGVTQPFLGRLYDRYGGRIVISLSLLVLGAATMLLSLTNNIWFLFVIYGFVTSTATSGVSLVTIHALLSKWFHHKRSLVLSLATAGTSAGGLLLVPLASSLIEVANWRVTWLMLGGIVILLALPVVLFIVKDSPDEIGELPDGEGAPDSSGSTAGTTASAPQGPLESDNWLDAFRSKPIWQLSGAYFVCGVTTIIISTHYVPFAQDRGVSPQMAASAFGLMMGLNAVGVVVIGILSTKFSRKKLLGTVYFVRFLAYMMLVFGPNAIGIWGFAVMAGLSWIASPPLTTSLTADIYGLKNIGTLNGISTFSHQIGGSISVLMAGVLYDNVSSLEIPLGFTSLTLVGYEVPFLLAGLTLLGATLASYSVRESTYSMRYQPIRTTPAVASSSDGD